MQNNLNQSLKQANLSINIQSLSPKQLLGQCIDLATIMLKELITNFCQTNNIDFPFTNNKVDFTGCANYILEPTKIQAILNQYVNGDDKAMKSLAKSWFFQLKYLRNCWAHSESIHKRLTIRGFDTLALLFELLKGDTNSEMFQKIEFYRKTLTIAEAKIYVS